MRKSKRAIRQQILAQLYEHLQQQYSFGQSREVLLGDQSSPHTLDAILSFKSDPRLNELKRALDQLDEGTFGICIFCKGRIPQSVLDQDPIQRLCARCEQAIAHPTTLQYTSSIL